ncbi:MAG: H4MPT-linked C1 transfer pathway protein [Methylococcaceae bacterium]|nr:H4MPT-linked C1 transfer pathway protein [Methylococcaceae bacterium]
MSFTVVGWDVGGAHLKAALVVDGVVKQVEQTVCPLWKGVEQLELAIQRILENIGPPPSLHAVTMTGELVDCFKTRQEGVDAIIRTLQHGLPNPELMIYAGNRGFMSPADLVADDYSRIASANWLASASVAAQYYQEALFIDIGSTTTDILVIHEHQVDALGYTDYQRLVSGELLYTGAVRTPVMAICQQADFNGQTMGLMAEYFATMADVYRITQDLEPQHDQSDTADGGDKTLPASALRLSRLTGYEFLEQDWTLWQAFAEYIKAQQIELIEKACVRQWQRIHKPESRTLIAAGVGRFLLKNIAQRLQLNYVDFADLITSTADNAVDAGDCAPAVAVAILASGLTTIS